MLSESNSYTDEEDFYWLQLYEALKRYKAELETNNVELAKGLGISRQSLVLFLQKPSHGLPIQRSNLMQLWDFLTDAEQLETKKLSAQARANRIQLRNEGYNWLLKAAGFIPGREVAPFCSDKVHNWSDNLKGQIATWFKKYPNIESDRQDQLYKAMVRICASGNSQFSERAIEQLYYCIKKNAEYFDGYESQWSNLQITLKITNCEFTTISFLMETFIVNGGIQDIKDELTNSKTDAEVKLRSEYFNIAEKISYKIPPVIKVTVSSILKRRSNSNIISWFYASDKTHYENIFAAITQAMGYASQLDIERANTEILGRKDHSLVKAKIKLTCQERGQMYESEWVDRSTIVSVLQSTAIAAINWLRDYTEKINKQDKYYRLFEDYLIVENELERVENLLNGYVIRVECPKKNISLNLYIQEIIDRIEKIEKNFRADCKIFDLYRLQLKQKKCIANLILARLENVRGNIQQVKVILEETSQFLQEIRDCTPTQILFELEEMVWQLFSGDRKFLENREWIGKQKHWLERIRKYIKIGNVQYGNYPGSCNLNIYDCASEIFGRIGRLDFRFDNNETKNLENAIDNLLQAAYCASRIGHYERVTHWLANASRAYCRLGKGQKARQLVDLAHEISFRAIEPKCNVDFRQSFTAEINLAHAERYLLIEQNKLESIRYFLLSLKGAIYLEFARLISESLYGIARASQNLQYPINELFSDVINITDQKLESENKIVINIIEFLRKIDQEREWHSVSDAFKQQAVKIWDDWFRETYPDEKGRHPIAEMMDERKFLCKLD